MSKLSFTPNVSGTGTINIVAPNTNTNQTLTLPDATTTLVGTDNIQTLTNKTLTSPILTGTTTFTDTISSGNGSFTNTVSAVTVRATNYLDASGGNTATINGVTPSIPSRIVAITGKNNTTFMTPLLTNEVATSIAAALAIALG